MARSLAPKSSRDHELVLDVPSAESYRLRYVLPKGYRFSRTPSPATIDSPVGRVSLEVTTDAQGAEVRTRLELRRHRISPKDYPTFRKFLRDVDAKLEQDFELVPAK